MLDQSNALPKCLSGATESPRLMSAADYSDGGYKDIDINTKILALNVTWANFYFWKVNPDNLFKHLGLGNYFSF